MQNSINFILKKDHIVHLFIINYIYYSSNFTSMLFFDISISVKMVILNIIENRTTIRDVPRYTLLM